ncbi:MULTISPECIES: hypothetical protein [Neisseria]|uniref:AraC-type arabinose-binding/dimerisation domain-containing protein n=1 Tax=Neisseria animaloris TaxID=326522 RepID=A0A3S5A2S0_9NEIS|nr:MULTISPECIES: hypothetical protein [Neisseria]MDO1510928.1 hypothetical protein [Neisseria sp. MVDL19-042950]MDO1516849.1 hypothetical protein [Neisseria sp. MVDL18-041461]MDO1563939.1 hypothetical protein [Neisseria sp. MVDL20-010259]MDO5074018.1 hypothetical protein [Neisseria animaloris]VEJ20887.1 Uncharacterised protein [Neisseria animaloris]
MKQYTLDPHALIGGVIAEDNDQQIVQLSLQKDNEIPTYETDAIILLIVLNGSAQIITEKETLDTKGLQVVRLEPHEAHSIRALENNTNILVFKQLTHELVFSKKLRFGSCCM